MLLLLLLTIHSSIAACPSSVITSSTPYSLVDRGGGSFTPSVQIPKNPAWVSLPGAQYIWESNAYSLGPFRYLTTFSMAEWARKRITSLHLLIACDNRFAITFNGVVIAPRWSGDYSHIWSYELKQYLKGSDATLGFQDNLLEIYGYNLGGPAGLIFKLEITY